MVKKTEACIYADLFKHVMSRLSCLSHPHSTVEPILQHLQCKLKHCVSHEYAMIPKPVEGRGGAQDIKIGCNCPSQHFQPMVSTGGSSGVAHGAFFQIIVW